MISYTFIQSLFANVLQKSKTIEGRFFICDNQGREINGETLSELVQTTVANMPVKTYPLAMMLPPVSLGKFNQNAGEWKNMRFTIFFLRSSYYLNGQVSNINPDTQTSTRQILNDWADMEVAAVDFLRVIDKVQRTRPLVNDKLRMLNTGKTITPISSIGVDRAGGVRMDFEASVMIGCEIEDYSDEDIVNIEIPN